MPREKFRTSDPGACLFQGDDRKPTVRIIVECFTKWRGSVEAEVSLDFGIGARKASSKRSRESSTEAAIAHRSCSWTLREAMRLRAQQLGNVNLNQMKLQKFNIGII